eukprot:1567634-Amphidinium_carterae.1
MNTSCGARPWTMMTLGATTKPGIVSDTRSALTLLLPVNDTITDLDVVQPTAQAHTHACQCLEALSLVADCRCV